MAKKSMINKQQKDAQVFHACLHPLHDLRKTARRPEKVRDLPYLLQEPRIQGPDPRREEVELVRRQEMTDPIADMLTRIRNGLTVHKETVEVPSSKMKSAIAQIMLEEGYLKGVELVEDGFNGKLVLTLKYTDDNRSVINGLKRVSKPGLRTYSGAKKMPKVLGGFGIAIVSTNQGIMTDKQAKLKNVGGEVLCYVY